MYYGIKNIIFRNIILLILSCCVLEKTGISIVSQVITCLQAEESDFFLADIEDETKESENNKESSSRESWIAVNDFSMPHPVAMANLLAHTIYDCGYYDMFYPTVPTPPPNGLA